MTDDITFADLEYICTSGWIRIGIINEIRMYPLETGHGFKVSKAICTNNGLQSLSLTEENLKSEPQFRYFDRVFVPYSYTEDRYSLLNNPTVAECTSWSVFHSAQKRASKIGNGWFSKVDYLGKTIELFDINCHLKHPIEGEFGTVGYIPQKTRKQFFSQFRSSDLKRPQGNAFRSCFYPYTLINTTSLDLLTDEHEGSEKILTIDKLSPNFVIEANEPYCEDEIVALKIGNKARFANVVPCTYDLEECEYGVVTKAKQREFINKLKETRALRKVHPYLSKTSDLPVLGINLEIVDQGEICLYDDVVAKFRVFPIPEDYHFQMSDSEEEKTMSQ